MGARGCETDTDGDGLADQFQQTLVQKFAPRFYISTRDCYVAPAELLPVKARNRTFMDGYFRPAWQRSRRVYRDSLLALVGSGLRLQQTALDTESVSALAGGEQPIASRGLARWHFDTAQPFRR